MTLVLSNGVLATWNSACCGDPKGVTDIVNRRPRLSEKEDREVSSGTTTVFAVSMV